jgi:hypothetical protein
VAPLPQGVGRWFHIAAVGERDGSVRLHLDGVEIARSSARRLDSRPGNIAESPFDNPLLVGAANNDADPTRVDQKLNGAVDELLVYDRALPARQIALLARGIQPRL